MSSRIIDIVELHKREMRRIMAEVWRRYDRVPEERKAEARRLIEAWFNDELSYEELLAKLEELATENKTPKS